MAKPILYDEALAEQLQERKRTGFKWPIVERLQACTPFVIDPDTVDEACMQLPFLHDVPLLERAALPFPHMWLEFSIPEELQELQGKNTCDYIGFLLDETEGSEGQRVWKEPKGTVTADIFLRRRNKCVTPAFSLMWHPTKQVNIWAQAVHTDDYREAHPGEHTSSGKMDGLNADYFRSLVFGLKDRPGWMDRIGGIMTGKLDKTRDKEGMTGIQFPVSSIPPAASGLIIPILFMLANCRYSQQTISPKGYWLNRKHRPHQHTTHSVVRIETSSRPVREQSEDHVPGPPRREHDVRAHYRHIRRGRPDEYAVLVKSHKRGNPEYGKVIHDHYVTANVTRH